MRSIAGTATLTDFINHEDKTNPESGITALALPAVAPDDGDLTLAGRVAAGDAKAFEAIMRRHNRMLYRVARSILGDDAVTEDCLQSAYLVAYRSIASYEGHGKLSTWLARIVINEALTPKPRQARSGVIIPFDGAADAEDERAYPPAR